MILLALALQAATTTTTPAPERFSILAPSCPSPAGNGDIVVCKGVDSQRIPLPDDVDPADHGIPSNPDLRGTRAMALEAPPCRATQWGCTVGVGPPVMPLVTGAVGLAKGLVARKPDKRGRVAIPLDDPAPASTTATVAAPTP